MAVLAAKNGGSAGCANGVGAVDVLQENALTGQAIDVGGWAKFLEVTSIAANRLPGMVIRHD